MTEILQLDLTDAELVTKQLQLKQNQLEQKKAQLALVRQLIHHKKEATTPQVARFTSPVLKNTSSNETSLTVDKLVAQQVQGNKGAGAVGVGGKRLGVQLVEALQVPAQKRVCQEKANLGEGRDWGIYDKAAKLIRRIRSHQDAEPFRKSVDTVRYGCPDYYNVIKRPMDLGTMLQKINEGRYDDVWQVKTDLDLIWSNCFLFNGLESRMGKIGQKLQAYSNKQWDKFVADNQLLDGEINRNGVQSAKPLSVSRLQDSQPLSTTTSQRPASTPYFGKRHNHTTSNNNVVNEDRFQTPHLSKQTIKPKRKKKYTKAIESDDDDDEEDDSDSECVDPPYAPAEPDEDDQPPPPPSYPQQTPTQFQYNQQQNFDSKTAMCEIPRKECITLKEKVLSEVETRQKLTDWIQSNFEQLQEEDHPQLAKCVGVESHCDDEEEAELDLESYSVIQIKNIQNFMMKRIEAYQKIASAKDGNKQQQVTRKNSYGNSEEVSSNQQTAVCGSAIKGRTPFLQQFQQIPPSLPPTSNPPNAPKQTNQPNNPQLIQIDSSLWKNLDDNKETDKDDNDDCDNDAGHGFNDSVSSESDQDNDDKDDEDIWSEFRTKDELQQAQKKQQEQDKQRQIDEEQGRKQREFQDNLAKQQALQQKIDREIQDLDKQAGGCNGCSSNSPLSGNNIHIGPTRRVSTDLLSIGLIRKKSMRSDLDDEYL